MTRRSMATGVAAMLGIVVSAALAWAASQLAGQRVGLASEPLSVATGLAPRPRSTPARAPGRRGDDHPGAARRPRAVVSRTTAARIPVSPAATTSPPAAVSATPAVVTQTGTTTSAAAAPHPSTVGSRGAFVPAVTGTARHPGHHGDGGDQHDD